MPPCTGSGAQRDREKAGLGAVTEPLHGLRDQQDAAPQQGLAATASP